MEKREESSKSIPGAINPPYNPIQINPYYYPYSAPYPHGHMKKLFVGQIPKTYTEEDVKQIFKNTCQVYSAIIIKDKATSEHRGCAFIYVDPSVAELVKEKYHNKYCCPTMSNRLQVRDANPPQRHHSNDHYQTSYSYQPIPVVPTSTQQGSTSEPVPLSDKSVNTSSTVSPAMENAPTASPVMMQQVPGMYSIPYYPMVPPNMMYPSMMIPVNNSSEVAQEPNASMTSVVTPVQPYMMPYIPVQPSSDQDGSHIPPVVAYPYQGENNIPMIMTPQGYMVPYQPFPVGTAFGNIPTQPPNEDKGRRDGPPEANLFVFNLPPDVDDKHLRELFAPYGEILSAKVIFEKETNMSKGYGFVNFCNETDAKRAIKEMNGRIVNRKKLTVQVKKPRS